MKFRRGTPICTYSEKAGHIFHIFVQPDTGEMRPEIVIRMEIEILHGQTSGFFSNEPFEKRPVMTIEDLDVHSDDRFYSHFSVIGLYSPSPTRWDSKWSSECKTKSKLESENCRSRSKNSGLEKSEKKGN